MGGGDGGPLVPKGWLKGGTGRFRAKVVGPPIFFANRRGDLAD